MQIKSKQTFPLFWVFYCHCVIDICWWWRCYRKVEVDCWGKVLKAPVSLPGEVLSPSPSQHPLIQCDISHSPANCAALTGSKHHTHTHNLKHTHTHTHTTYQDPAIPSTLLVCSGQLCLCQSVVPAAEVTLPKTERAQTALMRPHGGLEVYVHMSVWAHVCIHNGRSASPEWSSRPSWSTMCVWQSFSLLKVFSLQPFPSHRLSKSHCF